MRAHSRPAARWLVLLALLAGAGWLALFGDKTPVGAARPSLMKANDTAAPDRPTAVTKAPAGAATQASKASTAAIFEVLVARQELIAAAGARQRDLFALPPPPPPPKPVALPAPVPKAPPLPYRFIGKKFENGVWEVFLGRDDANHVVRAGSVLESAYRVERIEPPTIVLMHLPTQQTQTLPIGDAW